jgi:DNA-binding CsgD family transcriptional regulator
VGADRASREFPPRIPGLEAIWQGPPVLHEGCPADAALALLAQGTDRSGAVRLAELALDNELCLVHARCLWRGITVLLCAVELVSADAGLRRLERVGDEHLTDMLSVLRAHHSWIVGDLTGARRLASPLASKEAPVFVRRLAVPLLLDLLVAAGEFGSADAMLVEQDFEELMAGPPAVRALLLAARGGVNLSVGRFREATVDFLACGALPRAEVAASQSVLCYLGLAAVSASYDHRTQLAATLAVRQEEAALAWGSPGYVGWALYVRAIVGSPEVAIRLLADAIDLLETAHTRVALAWACYDLGTRLASLGDKTAAKEKFERAEQVARQIGNEYMAEKALAGLKGLAQSEKPPSLTMQEVKIAELARTGYSNKQIAERLVLTVRTIEFHLSNVYRKLQVSGRRELMDSSLTLR